MDSELKKQILELKDEEKKAHENLEVFRKIELAKLIAHINEYIELFDVLRLELDNNDSAGVVYVRDKVK